MTYEQARAAFGARLDAERADSAVDPRCYSILLDHGTATERAIAFFHGFTNCPQQFAALGQRFFEAGYNVYIPRLPGHGMKDKMTTALAGVSGEDLTRAAADAVRLAGGLGRRTHASGISLGGVLTAWVGDNLDIAAATAIAPFIAVAGLPAWANNLVASALFALPNFFMWWDPRTKANNPAVPPYAYARYPTRTLAAQLRIGLRLRASASSVAPKASVNGLFINAHDPAVNNRVAGQLYDRWQQRGARVVRETFDAGRLPHDIIDNSRGTLPVDAIYPAVLAAVARADALSEQAIE
ncbi:MAG: alpha/beta hydrolase [Candidatus Eremiobacteraeota bacterium]|nr:alpha/beta hydrolase [Candidatus Eremiobacteraeota bacterium]